MSRTVNVAPGTASMTLDESSIEDDPPKDMLTIDETLKMAIIMDPNDGDSWTVLADWLERNGERVMADALRTNSIRQLAWRAQVAEKAIEMLTGPFCNGCGLSIDPDCCWCGSSESGPHEGHAFVPVGCDCLRVTDAERDWKKTASDLRAWLIQSQKECVEAKATSERWRDRYLEAIEDGDS